MRLTRTNNSFQAYYSPDGYTWTQIGSTVVLSNMAVSAYAGLAVCAHNNAALNTSVFDSVSASFVPVLTAPVLAPVAGQTVNVGQTVAFTASATDTNLPPPTLTFSLPIAPAGASLTQTGNTSAIFSWRPAVTDANTTNPFALKVTDNSLPPLSATQNFTITVNPLTPPSVPSVFWSNGRFAMRVTNSILGPDYGVLASSNLMNWSLVFITNSPPANSFQWTDTNPATAPRSPIASKSARPCRARLRRAVNNLLKPSEFAPSSFALIPKPGETQFFTPRRQDAKHFADGDRCSWSRSKKWEGGTSGNRSASRRALNHP